MLNVVKTDLRTNLTGKSLDRLMLLKIEGPKDIGAFNYDEAYEFWCKAKDRRIFLPHYSKKLGD